MYTKTIMKKKSSILIKIQIMTNFVWSLWVFRLNFEFWGQFAATLAVKSAHTWHDLEELIKPYNLSHLASFYVASLQFYINLCLNHVNWISWVVSMETVHLRNNAQEAACKNSLFWNYGFFRTFWYIVCLVAKYRK